MQFWLYVPQFTIASIIGYLSIGCLSQSLRRNQHYTPALHTLAIRPERDSTMNDFSAVTRRPLFKLLFLLFTGLLLGLLGCQPVLAQEQGAAPDAPTTFMYLPLTINGAVQSASEPAASEADSHKQPAPGIKLLVDTDPGVDDAVALAWLASQTRRPVQLLGVVSVAGNTSLYNTTNNLLTVMEKIGRPDVPVVMGAAGPLVRSLTKSGYFIHGPDGLWFLGWQSPHDLSGLPTDAPAFYCSTLAAHPGATLLALGPLTNIAQTIQRCPETLRTLGSLVILGGAKNGGNKTPVAEFNFWQDPEAAELVLSAGLPITLVPLDAFSQPILAQKDVDKLLRQGTAAIQFLAPAIQQYTNVQLSNTGRATLPDAAAAVAALDGAAGVRYSALVRLVLDSVAGRGQSVIGLATSERIAMLATEDDFNTLADRAFAIPPDPAFDLAQELGAILWRAPDNATVVTSLPADLLTKTVLPDLRNK